MVFFFVLNFIIWSINYFAVFTPIWNKYQSILDDHLCYTSSTEKILTPNNILSGLVIVLLMFTTLVCCLGITVAFILTSENYNNNKKNANDKKNARTRIDDKKWLILLATLMSALSSIGSIALTDALGLSDVHNGFIAIFTSTIALILASVKYILSSRQEPKKDDNNKQKEYDSKHLMRRKAIALFMSTLTDSVFDFFQGIAAVIGEEYGAGIFTVLVLATWIGVADELLECIIEIFFDATDSDGGCCGSLDYILLSWAVIESILDIYLLSTYQSSEIIGTGITAECFIIICSAILLVYYINYYWKSKKNAGK
eukprot:211822_1